MKNALSALLVLSSVSAFAIDCTKDQKSKELNLTARLNSAQINNEISDTRAWLAELGRQKAAKVNYNSCEDYLGVYSAIVEDLLK